MSSTIPPISPRDGFWAIDIDCLVHHEYLISEGKTFSNQIPVYEEGQVDKAIVWET
jgi:hypothetical protein